MKEYLDHRSGQVRFLSYFFGGVMLAILGFMAWYTSILSSNWCNIPLGIEAAAKEQNTNNVTALCFDLQKQQINALSNALYGLTGTITLSVLVYVIIVWAGAKFSGEAGPTGAKWNVERDSEPSD